MSPRHRSDRLLVRWCLGTRRTGQRLFAEAPYPFLERKHSRWTLVSSAFVSLRAHFRYFCLTGRCRPLPWPYAVPMPSGRGTGTTGTAAAHASRRARFGGEVPGARGQTSCRAADKPHYLPSTGHPAPHEPTACDGPTRATPGSRSRDEAHWGAEPLDTSRRTPCEAGCEDQGGVGYSFLWPLALLPLPGMPPLMTPRAPRIVEYPEGLRTPARAYEFSLPLIG